MREYRAQARDVKLSTPQKARFNRIVSKLIAWYKKNQRSFIWREVGVSPYTVLISEYMLQQTQAAMIEKRLPLFLKQFPTVSELANASQSEVLRAWQGLGYNRRALNLHRAAKVINEAGFPETEAGLMALPGVGRYTANAVLSFAWNKPVAVVDVNIERVLSRTWKRMPDTSAVLPMKEIAALDLAILPKRRSGLWHQALMDLGANICTKRRPKCETCPLLVECPSGKGFINSSGAPATSRKVAETKYFGFPRRIWRGKVLAAIAEAPKTTKEIAMAISARPTTEFLSFVDTLARTLVNEGFCELRKKKYALK